ncbi:glycoside hydrolase family 2 TIM barrel-domain containing protein [Clostridium sp.]|uniref:glycoside hydrolase family 2 protein n=1 Tax=Clostridium sp. TaxID=1506 RepID=UPI002850140C|nr:glycoside hydrolase family 2 TIM barrel-domain containing protein [Clostridium sp.]MDR3593754.1 glycoside hydrolase family 2 TIM barrel-domain containing protein [Clostridium sp.]
MIRGFEAHKIRKQLELDGLWEFSTCAGDHKDEVYKITVPSCWESHPKFSNYRGKALYRNSLEAEGNIRLVFKGVSHTAKVIFDNRIAVEHYNAYTQFETIIKNVGCGLHSIEVEVDNSFNEDSALHIPNDYQSYGGISRPVIVEFLPDIFIKYVHFTPTYEDRGWFGNVTVEIENLSHKAHDAKIMIELNDNKYVFPITNIQGLETIKLSEKFKFENVEAYELESPKLYMLKTKLYMDGIEQALDDLIERIGFREVLIQGKDILFNGKKLNIKGFCRHEDHPLFGCSLPYQALDYDINLMLDMGANAVRTSHYPNDELFLDLCDEKGLLVWEESHARGLTEESMKNKNFDIQSENCIREMIVNHYNHPSILIWGILNECASETEYGKKCYAKQFDQIKQLDKSRPTTFASCKIKNDISLGLPDVISFNAYPGWYEDASESEYIKEIYDWVQKDTEGNCKPFIISEIGAGAIYGYRTPTSVKWSEERQASILKKQLEAVFSQQEIVGAFIWQFCDIRVSEEWFSMRPRTMNNKGIVDEFRRRKLSYDIVRNIFMTISNYK